MKRNLVTAEELAAIERVNDDCMKLHVCPPPVTFVDMEVRNADGELVDGFTMKSNSWVRNLYNLNFLILQGFNQAGTGYAAGSLQGKQVDGTVGNIASGGIGWSGGVGVDTEGVVVGTGTTAETLESYALTAKIVNGNGAGQLAYQADTFSTPAYNSGTKKWTLVRSRVFNNNSGASISVGEVGLHLMRGGTYLGARDVLGTPVPVPNGGQLTVTYTIEMTFPG